MKWLQRRSIRWSLIGLILFALLLAAGRQGQIYLQSLPQGARGPYLQMPAPDGMTIRWQSLNAEKGVVHYGSSMEHLDKVAEGPVGKLHEVRLSGLDADSRYFYSVGGDIYHFRTSPLPGSDRPVRLWVQGDAGRAIPTTMLGRDAALQWSAIHPRGTLPAIDLWLTTGDNAYRSGKDEEFQKNLFEAYPTLLPTVPYLPVHGNHDARRNAFYRLFTFPTRGEAGGEPSGSEHYFSLDYGQVHLVFLDSEGDLAKGSAMLAWLQRDLATSRQPWIIALLHHPPYTRGSHDSDSLFDSRGRLRSVRENVVPILEQGGVDLALFGHSHVYERSHLLSCHYGDSKSFTPQMVLQESASGEYRKGPGHEPQGGTIYNVVGSSSRADGGPLDYPAMAVGRSESGSLMIDVAGTTLTARFITTAATVTDSYKIVKGGQAAPYNPVCRKAEGEGMQLRKQDLKAP